jgi:hypothetical protein
MATGVTAAERANQLLAVEHAKAIVKALGGNPSLICTTDHAYAHIDASLGTGSEQTSARALLDKIGHKHA